VRGLYDPRPDGSHGVRVTTAAAAARGTWLAELHDALGAEVTTRMAAVHEVSPTDAHRTAHGQGRRRLRPAGILDPGTVFRAAPADLTAVAALATT
jgi:hypothetical protein